MTRLLFFASLIAAAQSPDWSQRWDEYVERTYSWKRIAAVSAETVFEQGVNWNSCIRPPYCLPHEVGGALVRRTARTTIELGAGALLQEDAHRRPSNLTGFRARATFALLHAPLAKNADGEWRPAYSRFAGTLGGIAVSSAYHGHALTADRFAESFAWSISSYFEDALWSEFEPDVKRHALRLARRVRILR